MQKKLIALAAAAAFSAPAFADNGNVTVYGKVNLDYESVSQGTAAVTSVSRIQSNASRLGLKGKEDLGDGLNAIWQLEVQVDASGSGQAANNGTAGFSNATRNSNIGLQGGFGTVFYGIWDTPYKLTHNKIELFDNAGSFTSTNLIGHANGATAVAANTNNVNFTTRQNQTVQYWSPKLADAFQVKLGYAPDSTGNNAAAKTRTSASAEYDKSAIYAALAYETRANQTAVGINDTATRFVGAYDFGVARIGLTYESLSAANGTAATTSSNQKNWELMGEATLGSSKLALLYVKAGNFGANAASGATQTTLRYGYSFSKRTELYAAYTTLKNDVNTRAYRISAQGANGSSSSVFGLGMIHSF